jgi:hypothetical protein
MTIRDQYCPVITSIYHVIMNIYTNKMRRVIWLYFHYFQYLSTCFFISPPMSKYT